MHMEMYGSPVDAFMDTGYFRQAKPIKWDSLLLPATFVVITALELNPSISCA